MRLLKTSATKTFPLTSTATPMVAVNCPSPLPPLPHLMRKVPVFVNFWMRLLKRSVTKTFPLPSTAMPSSPLNCPSPLPALPHLVRKPPHSPQLGGIGFVAALHAALSDFFSSLHAFLQTLSLQQPDLHALASATMCFLQSLRHLARAGDAVRPAPTSSIANPANQGTPAFRMALGAGASSRRWLGVKGKQRLR